MDAPTVAQIDAEIAELHAKRCACEPESTVNRRILARRIDRLLDQRNELTDA